MQSQFVAIEKKKEKTSLGSRPSHIGLANREAKRNEKKGERHENA
jgi:hypothetical protein